MNDLEKAFNELDAVEEMLKNKSADYMFGCLTAAAQARTMNVITELKEKVVYLKDKIQRIQAFVTRYSDMKSGKIKTGPRAVRGKTRNGDAGDYMYANLHPRLFMFSPKDTQCEFCKRTETSRTAVVFTPDPISGELVDICEYCHIEHNQQKQK